MTNDAPLEAVFEGSDGSYHTEWEVERNLRRGTWKPCLRQRDPDRRLVETEERALLLLTPVELAELPPWTEVRIGERERERRVVDTRRSSPT